MRALEPRAAGALRLRGFTVAYEAFGDPRAPTVLLLPCWSIIHSRIWKFQVPFLARRYNVLTFDSAGNGGGERSTAPAAYQYERVVAQAFGLLDHLGLERAAVVGFSRGCAYGILMAAERPERITSLTLISAGVVPSTWDVPKGDAFLEHRDHYEGWQQYNAHLWREDYRSFVTFFFHAVFPEPHSTKAIEDCISWAGETTPEVLIQTVDQGNLLPAAPPAALIVRVRCPTLLIHGDRDFLGRIACSRALAAARPDWQYVELEGCGHAPQVRDPARVNLLLADALGQPQAAPSGVWTRASARRGRRALFVSSPIGLGHVQRDLAIARELRRLVPDLRIDWLAQHPVTAVLEASGETIHPLSAQLSNESTHWEAAGHNYTLPCFDAWRAMDEILCANFMVFLDAVRATPYDLWVGDEAWEVDHYLHENPELKCAPYVFLTDFLGWLPIDRAPGSREALLCADYNAEMLEQVARYGRVRDRAIYVGDYEDLVDESFGPGLPGIRAWAREHFAAVGYIAPFDPADYVDRAALRARLGHDPAAPLVVAAVGGTNIGRPLLRRILEAWPRIRRGRPDARLLLVAGPRIDAATLPQAAGVEARPYVHNLYEHLACCDLGIAQGGLSTTMELTVGRRPFLYFPLRDHCEQVYHVAHRLERYGAGRKLEYAATSATQLAEAALATLGTDTSGYLPYRPGAAARAAVLIAELL